MARRPFEQGHVSSVTIGAGDGVHGVGGLKCCTCQSWSSRQGVGVLGSARGCRGESGLLRRGEDPMVGDREPARGDYHCDPLG